MSTGEMKTLNDKTIDRAERHTILLSRVRRFVLEQDKDGAHGDELSWCLAYVATEMPEYFKEEVIAAIPIVTAAIRTATINALEARSEPPATNAGSEGNVVAFPGGESVE